jgi:UDP-N-acetylmuramoyl-tripeptide--D-alanyl-D-alanine ligase
MNIRELHSIFLKQKLISTDTRRISAGCLFFALKGENFNGNRFASEAIEKGAHAVIVDEDVPLNNEKTIRVKNVLEALQQLANYHRRYLGTVILAITGSNGKTTTKELCNAVLSEKYNVCATRGNLNNHIGVPLTLLSMDKTTDIGIIEMGANHPGEISLLCEIARPDHGIITNIGKAHLEGFGGIEGVARAKGELFNYLVHHNGNIFVNEGNKYVKKLVPKDYPGTVYYNGKSGITAVSSDSNPFLNLKVSHRDRILEMNTNLIGTYNTENVLAACCIGFYLKVDAENIVKAINQYKPANNRSQLMQTTRNKIYMDAYNANPTSMVTSIDEFLRFKNEKKLLILGEMRELGDSSSHEHHSLVNHLKDLQVKSVFCVGQAFKKHAKDAGFKYFETTDDLSSYLLLKPLEGYFVFLKGSRSNQLEKLIPLL